MSRHRPGLGERSTKEFGQDGGTIGRSLESDWVLPDAQRYLSSRHACIDYRSGSYYVIDTSTNGVYVNDSDRPVGRGNPQRLFSDDRIRIGEYVMRVEIDDTDSTGEQLVDTSHVDPVDTAMHVQLPAPATSDLVDETEITGIGIDLLLDEEQVQSLGATKPAPRSSGQFDLSSLSLEDTGGGDYTRTRPNPSAPAAHSDAPAPGPAANSRPPPMQDSGSSQAAAPKPSQAPTPKPSQVSQRAPAPRTSTQTAPQAPATRAQDPARSPAGTGRKAAASPGNSAAAFNAFLTGAGLPPQQLEAGEVEQAMHTLGRVMRETITGLTESLHLRAVQKSALKQSNTTIQPRDNNPLKFTSGVDESLMSLLFQKSAEYLPPVDAVRGAFKDIKLHEQALLRALYTAIDRYLERLDPDQVEAQFSSSRRGALLGAANKLKYWDYYKDLYLVVTQHPSGELPAQFLEELARAYEQEIGKAQAASAEQRETGTG